jgi:hypothetical protein
MPTSAVTVAGTVSGTVAGHAGEHPKYNVVQNNTMRVTTNQNHKGSVMMVIVSPVAKVSSPQRAVPICEANT